MTRISNNSDGNRRGRPPVHHKSGGANGSRGAPLVLHRLREARRQEGIERRTIARHLGTTIDEVKRQEDERSDLSLSVLHDWQRILDVPLPDLLVPPNDSLSPPVLRQAQLIQLTKLAATIAERSRDVPIKRLAQRMVDQLVEIMPELQEVESRTTSSAASR